MNLTTRSIQADLRGLVEVDDAGKLLTVLNAEGLTNYANRIGTIQGCSDEVRVIVNRVLNLSKHINASNPDPDTQVDWGFFVKVTVK